MEYSTSEHTSNSAVASRRDYGAVQYCTVKYSAVVCYDRPVEQILRNTTPWTIEVYCSTVALHVNRATYCMLRKALLSPSCAVVVVTACVSTCRHRWRPRRNYSTVIQWMHHNKTTVPPTRTHKHTHQLCTQMQQSSANNGASTHGAHTSTVL